MRRRTCRHEPHVEWIVCERTSRWASALRMALRGQRTRRIGCAKFAILAELDAELAERPTCARGDRSSIAAISPTCWPGCRRPSATFRGCALRRTLGSFARGGFRRDVCDALVEAGAAGDRRLAAATGRRSWPSAQRHAATRSKMPAESAPLVGRRSGRRCLGKPGDRR